MEAGLSLLPVRLLGPGKEEQRLNTQVLVLVGHNHSLLKLFGNESQNTQLHMNFE
jgi:hypothetical protein